MAACCSRVFQYEFMQNAFLAGTVVAIMAGVVGYFVVLRRLAFATEALSHGGFAGATGAVVLGQDVFLGLAGLHHARPARSWASWATGCAGATWPSAARWPSRWRSARCF